MTDKDKPNVGAAPDAPGAPDSHLRDARLAQALQHMPDAHMQAGAQARLAVLQHAQEALASTPRPADSAAPPARRWWHWLLGTSGRQRTSHTAWGGALVSVLVASFITLMWYGQPVPDANPDMLANSGKAESTAPASPPVAAMAEAKRPEPPVKAQLKQESVKEARKPIIPNAAEAPPPPFIPPPEVRAAAAPPPAPAPVTAPFTRAPPAPAPPPPAESAMQLAPTGSMADAVPVARAHAELGMAKISPAPATKARSELVDIQSGDQLRRVPVSQAAALLAYLRALAPQTAGAAAEPVTAPAAAMATPSITIRTAQGDRWDVWPTQVRVQAATMGKPDAATPLQIFAISPLQYETLRSLIERVSP